MLNTIAVQGRITADPEIRVTQTGKKVCSFTVACDRNGRDSGTDFIPCVAWEQRAEFLKNYFSKGDLMIVRGRLTSRRYEQDGKQRTAYEILVDETLFCGSKREKAPEKPVTFSDFVDDISESDLPF